MKVVLLFTLTLIFSIFHAHAKSSWHKAKPKSQPVLQVSRFGCQLFDSDKVFVEYPLTDQIALQSGLGHKVSFRNLAHNLKNLKLVDNWKELYTLHYLFLPLTLRYYVEARKHFCWFGGINFYYLMSGNKRWPDSIYKIGLKQEIGKEKASKYDISINIGFDYETQFGLIWGFNVYEQGLITVLEEPESFKNSQGMRFMLGYNFAKLIG